MNIMHVIPGLSVGGAEMMLYKIVSHRSAGVTHVVLCLSGDENLPMARKIQDSGVNIFFVNIKSLNLIKNLLYLNRICRSQSPDIIQGWMYHGNIFSVFLSLFFRHKRIIFWNVRRSLHGIKTEKLITRIIIKINALFSFVPKKIIYNSNAGLLQHQKIGFDTRKSILIPNGFDTSVFKPDSMLRNSVRKELQILEKEIVIGIVGRYHPVKGYDIFLSAASMAVNRFSNLKFILVGSDIVWENIDLKSKIEDLNLSKYIFLLGSRTDIDRIMNAFDIATSASLGESFSNALGEALSTGVPCVATDVGDSRVVLGGYGVVVEPNSASSLFNGWCQIISMDQEKRLYMTQSGRDNILKNYNIDSISSMYEENYKKFI